MMVVVDKACNLPAYLGAVNDCVNEYMKSGGKNDVATALNRDRDVSRTSWHIGNSSGMNRCIWGVSSDISGVPSLIEFFLVEEIFLFMGP